MKRWSFTPTQEKSFSSWYISRDKVEPRGLGKSLCMAPALGATVCNRSGTVGGWSIRSVPRVLPCKGNGMSPCCSSNHSFPAEYLWGEPQDDHLPLCQCGVATSLVNRLHRVSTEKLQRMSPLKRLLGQPWSRVGSLL